jgi:hypothetical protein
MSKKLLVLLGVGLFVVLIGGGARAADVEIKLDDNEGGSALSIKNLASTEVARINSKGTIEGTRLEIRSNSGGAAAIGFNNNASGDNAVALGNQSTASGPNSLAGGIQSVAAEQDSLAFGDQAIVNTGAYVSGAIGQKVSASAPNSFAIGRRLQANADNSFVLGSGQDDTHPLINDKQHSLMIGFYSTTPGVYIDQDGIGIGTTETDPASYKLNVAGKIKVTGGNPGTGKVLTSDNNGLASWQAAGGTVGGSGAANKVSFWTDASTLSYNNNFHWDNVNSRLGIGTSTPGAKLVVQTGNSGAAEMGDSNTASGNYAVAMGAGSTASGLYSVAMGQGANASGTASIAMGSGAVSSGNGSVAMGSNTAASSYDAVAMGFSTNASGTSSTAMGNQSVASGGNSLAGGFQSAASSENSMAFGEHATVGSDAYVSAAIGKNVSVSRPDSFVLGRNLQATADNTIILGSGQDGDPLVNDKQKSLMVGFYSSTPSLYVDQNGVGIGTTETSSVKLNVAGQIKISGGSPGAGKILTSDDYGLAYWGDAFSPASDYGRSGIAADLYEATTKLSDKYALANQVVRGSGTANYVSKFTDSTTLENSQIYDNGTNIGIGTTSPGAKLDVNTFTSGAAAIGDHATAHGDRSIAMGSSVSAEATNSFAIGSGSGLTPLINNTENSLMVGFNSTTPMLYVGQNMVGIDTIEAAAKLNVNGTIKISGGSPGTGKVLTSDDNGLAYWDTPFSSNADYGRSGIATDLYEATTKLSDKYALANQVVKKAGDIMTGTLSIEGAMLEVKNNSSGAASLGGYNNIVNGAHAVAIGNNNTASNDETFAVGNTSTAEGVQSIAMGSNSRASGIQAVAIGTNAIAGGNNSLVLGYNVQAPNNTSYNNSFVIGIGEMPGAPLIGKQNSLSVGFLSSSPMLYVDNNHVGIGTSEIDVSAKLQVAGPVKIVDGTEGANKVLTSNGSGLASWQTPSGTVGGSGTPTYLPLWSGSSTLTDSVIYQNSGNVGIGTTSPSAKLEVETSGGAAVIGGVNNSATGVHAVAIGENCDAKNQEAFAVGFASTAEGFQSIAMGIYSKASGGQTVAVGYDATASGTQSMAFGRNVQATNPGSIVIGQGITPSGLPLVNNKDQSLMVGFNTTEATLFVDGNNVGIGTTNPGAKLEVETSGGAAAIGGVNNSATGPHAVAIGENCTASNQETFAVGFASTAEGIQSIAMGVYSKASNGQAVAVGYDAIANGNNSMAFGRMVRADADGSIVIGSGNAPGGPWLVNDKSSSLMVGFLHSYPTLYVDEDNVGIGTSEPNVSNLLEVAGKVQMDGFRLNSSTSPGYVLTSDGSGNGTWEAASVGPTGSGASNTVAIWSGTNTLTSTGELYWDIASSRLGIAAYSIPAYRVLIGTNSSPTDESIVARGSFGVGSDAPSGAGERFMWLTKKAAFRAGVVSGDQWDDTNIGNLSFAAGYNATASGGRSVAMGDGPTASGNSSVAMGFRTRSTASNSFAMGNNTTAEADEAIAMGKNAVASNEGSIALGTNTSAGGIQAVAIGVNAVAGGNNSMALGLDIQSPSNNSFAIGVGQSSGSPLINNKTNSLMVGFLSSSPMLYVDNINVGIGTSEPDTSSKLEVAGRIKITGGSPGAGKVLTSDGTGLASWETAAGGIGGNGTTNYVSKFTGASTIGDSQIYDNGTNVGIGTASPGAKLDVEVASGGAATIGNSGNTASGNYSIAMGESTSATEEASTAMGYDTKAAGQFSTAMGGSTTASGQYSTAMGDGTTASGDDSTAMGYHTTANGNYSTAMGASTTASGNYSTAMGRNITVSGINSLGIGLSSGSDTVSANNTMAIMGGNVGIGSAEPQSKLDVAGDISGGAMLIASSAAGEGTVLATVNDNVFHTIIQMPVYIPAGTNSFRGKIRVKCNGGGTGASVDVKYIIAGISSTVFNTLSATFEDSSELTVSNIPSGWETLEISGKCYAGAGLPNCDINSFTIYSSN